MREAAHAAVALGGFLIIEKRERVRNACAGFNAKMLKESAADQMWRLAAHGADANIDAGFAKEDRLELGVGVGQMQDADIAKAADVVKVFVGCDTSARHNTGRRRGGETVQKISAMQPRVLPGQRVISE